MRKRFGGGYLQAWHSPSEAETPPEHTSQAFGPATAAAGPGSVRLVALLCNQFKLNTMEEKLVTDAAPLHVCQYGNDWTPILYSIQNGGYNVYHKDHNFSKQGNGGYAEKVVGMVLAIEDGKQVEFLPEKNRTGKHPDLQFDGVTWDVKYINDANVETIRKYIQHGKKADNLIFYWSPGYNKLENLKEATTRSLFRARKAGSDIPGIYYMYNLNGLKSLYRK